MSMQAIITEKVRANLSPEELLVENESHLHGGPATESHFKLTVVTAAFENDSRVKRHQKVYGILADELAGSIHALALHLYTPAEWQERQQQSPESPDCRGGSKVDDN